MDDKEISEVVDMVHSLVLQSRPPNGPVEDTMPKAPSRITVKSVPNSPCNLSRSQTIPVRKKVQIKSAPLKPPDIGNSSLFPSVEEATVMDTMASAAVMGRRVPLKSDSVKSAIVSSSVEVPGDSNGQDLERDKKFQTLEAKLTGRLGFQEDSSSGRRASLNELSTPNRKAPRSAKLFSELSSERREKLDELAEKYSKSIDRNQCRSILDELEFLFQLFNSNHALKDHRAEIEVPLLCSSAEQAYFVIKIVIQQLDKIFVSIPFSVLQLIIENYPHKIPKPVRKHIDEWIIAQRTIRKTSISSDTIPAELAKTVTFQSEKDGRSNFLHQTDFHNFCKQRDLFYSIRESWSSSGSSGGTNSNVMNTNSGIITDRSKSRMSFPPVHHANSPNKFVDPFPLKVQSLFQLNQNPTNLFHMASLFVSHYLLEARALEMGGVPKDDNMKEFFQSNPMKLLQLNSRFSTTVAETLESDQSSNFAFRKQFLLASSSKFVQHVVDRIVIEITKLENSMENVDLTNPSQICRSIKDNIHLARLLGYSHCLPYLADEKKQAPAISINSIEKESVMREQILLRSYQTPPIDLNYFLEKALKSGQLISTCSWIIEYLIQCDPVALLLPSYQPTLTILIKYYRTLLSTTNSNISTLCGSNKNFLRFSFGMLFASKNFPDSVFAQLRELCNASEIKSLQDSSLQDVHLDSIEDLGRSLIEFSFEETFNRFRRILSWGKLEISNSAMTGDFRHIRPIPASEKSTTSTQATSSSKAICKEKAIQIKLEATFFELYSPSIKRSVDFIAERMAFNFTTIAKSQLFPQLRTAFASQGVFGVRAAEKCRVRLGEDMKRYLMEKCSVTVKMFLEHAVTPGVLGICQRIAVRKARESGAEWIQNYISANMFPSLLEDKDAPKPTTSTVPSPQPASTTPSVPEEPSCEILILLHRMLRKLQSKEKVDSQLIDKVLSCQTFTRAPWAFVPLLDWGMSLITYQPQSLNSTRIRQLVNLWKSLWTPTANIFNSRNLMLLSKSSNPRDSWVTLGSVTKLLISEGMLDASSLEQQCFALLQDEWPEDVHKRISEFLTIVLEAFQEKAEWNSESAQVLDWVAWLCSGQQDQD